eukprot:1339243-Pyramimonas_sp.AAC.1
MKGDLRGFAKFSQQAQRELGEVVSEGEAAWMGRRMWDRLRDHNWAGWGNISHGQVEGKKSVGQVGGTSHTSADRQLCK